MKHRNRTKRRKTLLSLAIASVVMVGSLIFHPEKVCRATMDIPVTQTKASNNSVTFQWNYTTTNVDIYVNNELLVKNTSKSSYVLKKKGMGPGMHYDIMIVPTGEIAGVTYTVRTTPTTVVTEKVFYDEKTGDPSISWNSDYVQCDGYQIKTYDNKGKCISTKKITDTQISSIKELNLKNNTFCKVRIRGFMKVGNKTHYGYWSPYRYATVMTGASFVKQEKSTSIKVKWKKTKGVSKYDILIGTKADASDAIKVKTLNNKKTTYTISKIGKNSLDKSVYYYVFIKPYTKAEKKQVASDLLTSCGEPIIFYNY